MKTAMSHLLVKRREELNISQWDLGVLLGYSCGQFISNVERGMCDFPMKRAPQLARALKISQDTIVRMIQDIATAKKLKVTK